MYLDLEPPNIAAHSVVPYILASFATLIYYNAIELVVLCLSTFKRRGSLYFWCLFLTSISLIPNTSGYVVLFFRPDVSRYAAVTLIIVGWWGTVTGHSLVLWSRLNFVIQNTRLLNGLLVMIVVDAIVLHIPTTVLLYGAVSDDPGKTFGTGYGVMERLQLIAFCIQEAILSGIYVFETAKLLRLRPERRHRGILAQLLAMNVIVLILDIAVVVVEFVGLYSVQVMFKPVAYSVKLKLEYAVLGRLVEIAQGGSEIASSSVFAFDTVPSSAADSRAPSRGLLGMELSGTRNLDRQLSKLSRRPTSVEPG